MSLLCVSASVVLFLEPSNRVVLIERKFEPFKGMLAIPGGFLEPFSETLDCCASREFMEETGLWLPPESLELAGVQSDPLRDPRGHVINNTYFAVANDAVESGFCAGDDALAVRLTPLEEAMNIHLAADHDAILAETVRIYYRRFELLRTA